MSYKKVSSVFLLFVFLPAMVFADEWHVSPSGDDAHPGTADKPFRTLTRARDAVRADRAAKNPGPWTVHLAEGVFPITEPIHFGPEDSGSDEHPVLYTGQGDRTVFSGGLALEGWRKDDTVKDAEVWVVDLPKQDGETLYFEHLWVDGRRASRSRYPARGFLNPVEVRQGIPINEQNPKVASTPQSIIAKPGELDLLKAVPAAELRFAQFVVHHHWDTTRRIPLAYDAGENRLDMQGGPMKHWNPWRTTSQYFLENLRPAFTEPGQWFYDGAAGKAFYRARPGETLENCRFVVPRPGVRQLLAIKGTEENPVSNIRFENISFAYTDSPRRADVMRAAGLPESVTGKLDRPGPSQFEPAQAAFWSDSVIDVDTASNIAFRYCEIKHVGEYGLWLKNAKNCRVERCALVDLGAGGVRMGGVGKTSGNVLDNCIIQRGGRVHACAVAVWLGNHTEDNRVTHNDIGDFYYTGISAGWTWGYAGGNCFRNIIEGNRIHDLGQGAMADMGGVYTLGSLHGTRVRGNVIFNVKSYAYGGWGLYPDEGSEGLLMENNLVYDTTDGSFHQHYGKNNLIRNNILAFSRPHQVAVTRVENHRSLTFENNIIVWETGDAIGYRAEAARIDYGSNLWWNYAGKVDFKGKTHDDWKALGKDVGGMVADPLFVDPAARDFRLKDDSPALKAGFVPFDYSEAGVYGDEAWIRRAHKK